MLQARCCKKSLRHCWRRRCGTLQAFEGAKKQFRKVIKRECGQGTVATEAQARALGAAGEVPQEKSEALLEKALRDLTTFEGAKKQFRKVIKREWGQGTRWLLRHRQGL